MALSDYPLMTDGNWPPDPLAAPGYYRGVTLARVLAYGLDLVVIAILVFLTYLAMSLLVLATLGLAWPLYLLIPLVPISYHTLSLSGRAQATLGMRMLGLMVWSDSGRGPSLPQALCHTLLLYLTLSILGGLPLLIALFNARRRTIHDAMVGLAVLRRLPQRQKLRMRCGVAILLGSVAGAG